MNIQAKKEYMRNAIAADARYRSSTQRLQIALGAFHTLIEAVLPALEAAEDVTIDSSFSYDMPGTVTFYVGSAEQAAKVRAAFRGKCGIPTYCVWGKQVRETWNKALETVYTPERETIELFGERFTLTMKLRGLPPTCKEVRTTVVIPAVPEHTETRVTWVCGDNDSQENANEENQQETSGQRGGSGESQSRKRGREQSWRRVPGTQAPRRRKRTPG